MTEERVFSVAELTEKVAQKVEYAPDLKAVWVKGEIAECTRSSMGHWYFNLKDETAILKVVLFASQASNLKLILTSGIEVLVRGSVSVYRARGTYQLLATAVESAGMGAYRKALVELTERLEKEGLFAQKRPLPKLPFNIGLVTSKTGAALADVRRIIGRRWPLAIIKLFPCTVSGDEASESIIEALNKAYRAELDVLLLVRGGGSSEDLWPFNNEQLARTLYKSPIPSITGVGHEIDRTLVDLVADYAAPTPSGAAEIAVPDLNEISNRIDNLNVNLSQIAKQELLFRVKRVEVLSKAVEKHEPKKELKRLSERVKTLEMVLNKSSHFSLEQKKQAFFVLSQAFKDTSPKKNITANKALLKEYSLRLDTVSQKRFKEVEEKFNSLVYGLDLLNPSKVLKKGYALVYKEKKLIQSINELAKGQSLMIGLADGSFKAIVEETWQDLSPLKKEDWQGNGKNNCRDEKL